MMIMELLLELASTIALTLLLLHFVAMLVSSSPESCDSELAEVEIGLVRGCDFLLQSGISDSGIDNRVAIVEAEEEATVSRAREDDEDRSDDEEIVERVEIFKKDQESVDESLGISEDLGRIVEKLVEQEISAEHVEEEEEEAPVSQALEEDEIRSLGEKILEGYELQLKFLDSWEESEGFFLEKLIEQENLAEKAVTASQVLEEDLAYNVAEKTVMASQALEEDEKRCLVYQEISDEILDFSEGLGRLIENLVKQENFAENVREEEAPISQTLEEGENICADEKIVEHVENVQEFADEKSLVRLGEKLVEQEISCENGSSFDRELNSFDESSERDNAREIEECLGDEEDDDWVGIERTELEKLFGSAMAFAESKSNKARISVLENGVKTKLYGLRMIATQGPCLEPQPLALKFSSRAKWNAWQQLGDMTPETAMEQYVSLLSDSVPEWMNNELNGYEKQVLVEAGDERI